jgi:hypothetical protein
MKGMPKPGGNTGVQDMTNLIKLRRWGTALIKAGQKHRDPHMLTAGISLHLQSKKLGVPHDGDNVADGAMGTQAPPQLGTQAGS